jgi:hypothetical protein
MGSMPHQVEANFLFWEARGNEAAAAALDVSNRHIRLMQPDRANWRDRFFQT